MTNVKKSKGHNPIEKYLNVISPYHYYFYSLLFLSKIPPYWHVLSLIFLTPPIDYYCNNTITRSDTKNACPCEDPWWDRSVFTETIQTKFNMVCDNAWLVSFSQSMLYAGLLIGAFVFGFLSDKFGRVPSFSLSCFILAISGCLVCVMPNSTLFIVMRLIEGIAIAGTIVTSFVLCVEYCGARHREIITALYHIPLNISHMSLAGISYMLRHCDELQLALSVPMFLFLGFQWLVMESPKWLMDNGQIDKAAKVIERVTKYSRSSSPTVKEEMEAYVANQASSSKTKVEFWQIFKHRKLTINFLCMSFNYFVCGMGYYGVSQYIGRMNGDIHANVAISGALLLPGTIAAVFLLKILNRRPFLMTSNFLSGLLIIIVICIPEKWLWVRVVIACICNCFFLMSFIIVFLYGVELFPTTIRNSALGFLSVMSRAGQIVAPPINALSPTTSAIVFGVLAIMASVFCLPIPETKNTELPSTIEDSKRLSIKSIELIENPSSGANS
ncbi:unnamed protein product [Chilo suppressalis]|uniref:Major facilitator superfamily (MFS) profile domain-containing protein n=1 Tax=Chilo suppressalis TaxID=168631 RepID=A0ABN8ASQ5_CHISP|nr:hypothetical protein evm_011976 [Chilo suppressalis]CAH0397391.1 unnamed protein product [Chilo suppressalis]